VALAYVVGFLALLWVLGWHPGDTKRQPVHKTVTTQEYSVATQIYV
jgi:hypothetical protein